MKKQISLLLMVIMLCSLFVMPVSAYTVIDYSCYEGQWHWDAGDCELQINSCTDTTMSFYFRYGQFAVNVTNAKVDGTTVYAEYWEDWRGNEPASAIVSGYFTMSLGDSGIWLDWHDVQTFYNWDSTVDYSVTSDHGMMFYKNGFKLRYIEHLNIPVLLNGMPVEFDQQPVMYEDRVFVPMRKIFELMNADVFYDTGLYRRKDGSMTGQRITAIKQTSQHGGQKIVLDERDGQWTMRSMGANQYPANRYMECELYAQPLILSDRTLLPIRAISNGFGAKAEWDIENSRVIITGDISGQRKSAEDVTRMQSFTFDEAKKLVQKKYYYKEGTYAPEYDLNGKFYCFKVSDDGTKDGQEITIRVYHDGSIRNENEEKIIELLPLS